MAGIWMLRTPSGWPGRIHHGVHHRRRRAHRARFADARQPIGLNGQHQIVGKLVAEGREGRGARHGVIHERAGDELARVAVVDVLLEQRLADALRHAAVDLAEHDRTMQRTADVVDGGVALQVDVTGVGVDLDFADMRTPLGHAMPSTVFTFSMIDALVRLLCRQVAQADAAISTGDGETARGVDDVGGARLQRIGRQLLALVDQLLALPESTAEPPI